MFFSLSLKIQLGCFFVLPHRLQVAPNQFIPAAAAASPYGQVIQPALFPINQQFPISPGVVAAAAAQSPVISPPISSRPGAHMRLPMVSPTGGVMDSGIPSPSHLPPGGVTLVRPVAQVATPTRVSMKTSAFSKSFNSQSFHYTHTCTCCMYNVHVYTHIHIMYIHVSVMCMCA